MRGEIICIGDELISGRVSDKNAAYASARLNPLGLAVGAVSFIGDDPACIGDTLKRALGRRTSFWSRAGWASPTTI